MANTYTQAIRTRATKYANNHGPTAASEKYDVPLSTVKNWQRRATGEHVARDDKRKSTIAKRLPDICTAAGITVPGSPEKTTNEERAELCYTVMILAAENAAAMLSSMVINDKVLHALMGAIKIGAETGQLLSGKATARNENITREESRHALIEKLTSDKKLAGRVVPVLIELSGAGTNGHSSHN